LEREVEVGTEAPSALAVREAVAEIAVLPGLLGRLDPADFARLLDPTLTQPTPDRTPQLVSAAQTTGGGSASPAYG
jgi:hypothetical protein